MKNANRFLALLKFAPPPHVILLLLFLLLFKQAGEAQNGNTAIACQVFNVTKIVSFGIPTSANVDSISSFDLAGIRPYAENSQVSSSLLGNGRMAQTIFYPNGHNNPDAWITKVYRSEAIDNVVSLFDNSDSLIFSQPMGIPSDTFTPTTNQIINFGYAEALTVPNNDEIFAMVNDGFSYTTAINNTYAFLSDSVEYYINPLELSRETRFLNNGQVYLSVFEQLTLTNSGKYLPAFRITKSYLPAYLSNFRIQKLEKEIFSGYSSNCGQNSHKLANSNQDVSTSNQKSSLSVFRYKEDQSVRDKYFDCSLFPNPAKNEVNIGFPELLVDPVSIELFNENGSLVNKIQISSSNLVFDISSFPSGNYFVKIQLTNAIICKKLIIQK